ncbi:hypothetical protein J6590_029229 [Homalodisca vitripennis]|nr:hypothetical protein J6590_029229 [Homalodisca vitripennis]
MDEYLVAPKTSWNPDKSNAIIISRATKRKLKTRERVELCRQRVNRGPRHGISIETRQLNIAWPRGLPDRWRRPGHGVSTTQQLRRDALHSRAASDTYFTLSPFISSKRIEVV